MVFLLMKFQMLNDSNCSWYAHSSEQIENGVTSFIKGFSLGERVQVHALSICGLA